MAAHCVPGTPPEDSYMGHRYGPARWTFSDIAQTEGHNSKEIIGLESKCRHITMQI